MFRAEVLSCSLSMGQLIETIVAKADAEGLHRLLEMPRHQSDHCARVDSATQKGA